MKRFLVSLLIIGGIIFLAKINAFACKCESPDIRFTLKQQVNTSLELSDAVFSGKVLEIIKQPQNYKVSVRLLVKQSWKGIGLKEIVITTGLGGGDCGYPFEVGKLYLVYAYGSDKDQLSTNICRRTKEFSTADKEMKILGKVKVYRNEIRNHFTSNYKN